MPELHPRARAYIEATAFNSRNELAERLRHVADIHAQYAACHTGTSHRVGKMMELEALAAVDWLTDKRQHPHAFAMWACEKTGRLTIVLNACGTVNGAKPRDITALLEPDDFALRPHSRRAG